MHTDRDLLELAGKALGITVGAELVTGYYWAEQYVPGASPGQPRPFREWNPLMDDSQAFQLADQLKLSVVRVAPSMVAAVDLPPPFSRRVMAEGSDIADVRRAVVRAAANLACDMLETFQKNK